MAAAVKVTKSIILDMLIESSSSSEDEEILKYLKENRKKPKVKDYISNVIDNYTEVEFRKNLRLSRTTCEILIEMFENSHFFNKDRSHGGKEIISAKKQILSFLWFAGNQVVLRNVAELFDISESTFHAIISRLIEFFMQIAPQIIIFPKTNEDLQDTANKFMEVSNFPNVVGCIDGSYINIRTPAHKIKSTYVNRHDMPSLTLQGICDCNRRFIDVFTGIPGKLHDSRVFNLSFINATVKSIPEEYHLLGDAAYPLSVNILTPFRDYGNLTHEQINYNKAFSATRVLIENTFGILKGRFRQLKSMNFHTVERSSKFIIACCVLHNVCINNKDWLDDEDIDNNDDSDDEDEWERNVQGDNNSKILGERKRNRICTFLNQ